jgi:DNA-binding LacI/PurR family transcriptional regulator
MRKKTAISIRDIAEELNLNISTVSRALNRSYLISKTTTELVLRKAHEMGYHFQTQRKNIAILLPPSNVELAWYSINMLNALQKRLNKTDYYWEFINEDKIDIIQERSISGIISLEFAQHIAKKLNKNYNIPLVCINNASSHIDNVYSVNSDAENAIRTAFKCLYEYGHRNVAFITSGGMSFIGKKRKAAFEKIIEEYGLQENCVSVADRVRNYHGIVLELYKKGITAIITDGESAGLTIWNSLNFCKIDMPGKMSLIAWEMPYVSKMVNPAISTVEQDFNMIAEKAVYLLEAQFKNVSISEDILVPYQLHLRDTVSIPREI